MGGPMLGIGHGVPPQPLLKPVGKAKDYKEGGAAVKFDSFDGQKNKLKALIFLQQFDAAFSGGHFTEASKVRKAASFLKGNALQWWMTLLKQGVAPATWVDFKQAFAPLWLTSTFEVDVITAWHKLDCRDCNDLEENNQKFWDVLLPVTSFRYVPFVEQVEKYTCGLPKELRNYCIKTKASSLNQLIENAQTGYAMLTKTMTGFKGAFEVTERINEVSYRLRLPDHWKIHNAFHVSLLKPFSGDVPTDAVDEPQPEVEEQDEVLQPEQILAHKERKITPAFVAEAFKLPYTQDPSVLKVSNQMMNAEFGPVESTKGYYMIRNAPAKRQGQVGWSLSYVNMLVKNYYISKESYAFLHSAEKGMGETDEDMGSNDEVLEISRKQKSSLVVFDEQKPVIDKVREAPIVGVQLRVSKRRAKAEVVPASAESSVPSTPIVAKRAMMGFAAMPVQ
ncbi:hypothetical protein L7F22_017482 [Adiantum nelumboides]|nr:hypothetical protein [Adiantum nelumboides]